MKKEKQEKYLTIQGLLNHPYFIAINEAETTIIIEEFERLIEQQWGVGNLFINWLFSNLILNILYYKDEKEWY